MKKIWTLLMAAYFLSGCTGTVTKAVKIEREPLISVMDDMPDAAPNSVVTRLRRPDKENLTVDFLVKKVEAEPVFGVAINLSYNSDILKYSSYQEGNFLEKGGKPAGNQKPIYMVNVDSGAKRGEKFEKERLIVGATLFRGTPGVIGSGKLITLLFQVKKNEATEIVFTKKKLKNIQAKDIADIDWPTSIPIQPLP
jgi:hypothetical protein